MAGLIELCAALGSDLCPVPEVVVPSAELNGVHVSELSDPTPFLEGGGLLLTTGMPLRLTGLDTTAYFSRLVRRGVLGFLAQSGQQKLSAALGAQRALVRASAGTRPAETMVRRLSDVIDGWVVLLSADATVLTVRPREQGFLAEAVSQEIARLRMAGPHSAATFPLGDDDVVVYPLNAGGPAPRVSRRWVSRSDGPSGSAPHHHRGRVVVFRQHRRQPCLLAAPGPARRLGQFDSGW